jgi:DNA-damage-inducible protein D
LRATDNREDNSVSDIQPTNDDLVFVSDDGEPFTTSLVIGGETGNEHASVIKLIRDNASDLNEVGTLRFEIAKSGGRPTEYAVLDERASALLMTYLRNTPKVKDFKKRLVVGFYAMRQMLADARPALPDITTPEGIAAMASMFNDTAKQLVIVTNEKKCLESAIERDAPLVAKAEAHTGSDSSIHRQEFSREVIAWGRKQNVEIKQEQVFRFLGHIGLFIRGERTDTGHATADALKRGLAFTDKGTARNGHAWATGKLTTRGQDYAWKRITKHFSEHGTLELPRELRGGEAS